jgi:hypothetical protein
MEQLACNIPFPPPSRGNAEIIEMGPLSNRILVISFSFLPSNHFVVSNCAILYNYIIIMYWRGSSLRREAVTANPVITSALFEIQ